MSRICWSSAARSISNGIKTGLQHWVDGGRRGYLQWGILHFRKA